MKAGRTKIFLAAFLATASILLIARFIAYLRLQVPPPRVSIQFAGFEERGTSQYALIRMTNQGPQVIWPSPNWSAYIETGAGWSTNHPGRIPKTPVILDRSSNLVFQVDLPPGTIRWRVGVHYGYYHRHHVRMETMDRLLDSGACQKIPFPILKAMSSVLGWLPEPPEIWEEVSTPLLTNLPPVAFKPLHPSTK